MRKRKVCGIIFAVLGAIFALLPLIVDAFGGDGAAVILNGPLNLATELAAITCWLIALKITGIMDLFLEKIGLN